MSSHSNPIAVQDIENDIDDMLAVLAAHFPICTANDEFHFFPQIPPGNQYWSHWDDFSPESIANVCDQLIAWQARIEKYRSVDQPPALQIDLQLWQRILQTLHEQLAQVGYHRCQPTFYLTILAIGLAESIAAGAHHFVQRLGCAPDFLNQAAANLVQVPPIFGRLGREMAARLRAWLRSLPKSDGHHQVASVVAALEAFDLHLKRCQDDVAFLPPVDRYARIVSAHYGCRLNLSAIESELDCEIAETTDLLRDYAERIGRGQTWQAVVAGLKPPDVNIQPRQHFRNVIERLAQHCIKHGLVPPELPHRCPVTVLPIPDYMLPVRSNAAFSATPGHPARGGTFFVTEDDGREGVPADYRLLAAHETYPGHHLLDTRRWDHARPLRRPVEFPLFYEGWASFSEELLFETGFFHGPVDELLMAKRRFWRAIRGRVDYNIHCRHHSLQQAVDFLCRHGMASQRARAMVARYILKPGYQLAYTIGRRRFRRLYAQYNGAGQAADFTRLVLSQGEIEFDRLETIIVQGG